jgi:hypothetical protein
MVQLDLSPVSHCKLQSTVPVLANLASRETNEAREELGALYSMRFVLWTPLHFPPT